MADKTKTIKAATDKELDELIVRLRKENEVQDLIGYLRRKSNPDDFGSFNRTGISTEEPVESMYHVGVLGMRWGRRKARGGKISTPKKKTALDDSNDDASEDHKKSRVLVRKRLKEMTNDEIKALTSRLQLEKQYKELTKVEASPGKKFVSEILGNAAKTTATTYVTKYMTKGVEEILKKASK